MKIFIYSFFFSFIPTLAIATGHLNFTTTCDQKNDEAIIAFTGDVLIHRPLYLSVLNGKNHFSVLWEKTIPLLLKADFAVSNLEGPVASGIDPDGRDHGDVGFIYDDFIYSGTNFIFNYHPQLLSDLQDSGIDLITMANNHVMDRKSIGLDKSLFEAKRINLQTTGVKRSNEVNDVFYQIGKIKNLNIAFVGCSEFLNAPDINHQVLSCEGKEIIPLIKDLSNNKSVDAVIVLPHWGVEYYAGVKEYQRDYAHKFLEAGALAVLGSHPHVLEPWEKYTTKDKREGFIFYSLGNFVACQEGLDRQTGAIAFLGLTKKKDEKAKVFASAYSITFRKGYSIIPLTSIQAKELFPISLTYYGKEMFIELTDQLKSKMCQKFNRTSKKVQDH